MSVFSRPLMFLIAGPVLGMGLSAMAQTTGSLIKPEPIDIPEGGNRDEKIRQTMYGFARCVLKEAPNSVKAYLGTPPGSRPANEKARRLSQGDCLGSGSFEFSESAFRGAVYEVLYKDQFGRDVPRDLSNEPKIDYAAGVNMAEDWGQQSVALRQFADCVVRAAPAETHTLISSRAASATENASFSVLAPKFSSCIANGISLKFSKFGLRGVLGEALYRIRSTKGGKG